MNTPGSIGNGQQAEITPMGPADEAAVLAFGQALPPHDRLFMRRDISQPKVVKAWIAAIAADRASSLLAWADGRVIGCTALIRDPLSWSAHVGELRVAVDRSTRGQGLGRELIQRSFTQALERGLEKLFVQMTTDQRGAIAIFEELGFHPEALLAGHVRDQDGRDHDIVVLAHDVGKVQARMSAYGLDEPA